MNPWSVHLLSRCKLIQRLLCNVERLIVDVYTTRIEEHVFVQNYPQFWPAETGVEVAYGSLAVETLDVDENPSFITRSFRLRRVRLTVEL